MSGPSVSICAPIRNGARHLAAALESALSQTYPDFELLLVDDASTDGSVDVIAGFSDSRLRVHRNEQRLGIPANWNRCLALARGEYVKFLFQDDLLAPRALEALMAALRSAPDASFAFSRREIRYEGEPADDLPLAGGRGYAAVVSRFYSAFAGPLQGIELVRQALREGWDLAVNVVGEPSFVLMRRDAVLRAGGFDSTFVQLADWDLWLRLASQSPIVCVHESLGVFRVHAGGQSASNHGSLRTVTECIRILGGIRRYYGSRLTGRERRRLLAAQCRYAAHLVGELARSAGRVWPRPA